jgi:NAD(P)-dependent dehydrogenase (short-subunit alcohol dehydrogenase family)
MTAATDIVLTGYLADGSAGVRRPGVLVAHEGGGLGRHTKDRALRLAELGYVAFALDYYGEEDPSLDRAMALGQALRGDRPLFRSRLAAGLEVLTAQPGSTRASPESAIAWAGPQSSSWRGWARRSRRRRLPQRIDLLLNNAGLAPPMSPLQDADRRSRSRR